MIKFLGASALVAVGGSKPLPAFAEETDTSLARKVTDEGKRHAPKDIFYNCTLDCQFVRIE